MYFRSLHVLRGIAAVAVVLFHVNCYLESILAAPGTIFRAFNVGFGLGAWSFFSLSGFLMAYLIDTSRDRFLRRRLIRIYPTYWLAVALALLARVALFGTVTNRRLIPAASLLPIGGKARYPLGVEWTLIYEVFFYCVCALFAVAALRRLFPAFLACWAAAIVVANLGFDHPSPLLPTIGRIGFSLFNLLFIMGGLGYHAYRRLEPTPRVRGGLAAAACAGVAMYYFRDGRDLLGFFGLGLGFTSVILWGALGDRRDAPAPAGAFFERLGDASYGLYLVHVPIIIAVFELAAARPGLASPTTIGVIGTALALVGGWWFGKLDAAFQARLRGRLIRPRSGGGGGAAAPFALFRRRPVGVAARPGASAGRSARA